MSVLQAAQPEYCLKHAGAIRTDFRIGNLSNPSNCVNLADRAFKAGSEVVLYQYVAKSRWVIVGLSECNYQMRRRCFPLSPTESLQSFTMRSRFHLSRLLLMR